MGTRGFGYPFAPETVLLYNPSATAINQGEAAVWNATVQTPFAMPYPEPDLSGGVRPQLTNQATRSVGVTINVPGAVGYADTVAPTSTNNGPLGVAMEIISASSWGHIALSGRADVRIGPSQSIANGDPLVVTTAGCWVEETGPDAATVVHAMALEATITSGECTAALISAFVPRGIAFYDHTMNWSTA